MTYRNISRPSEEERPPFYFCGERAPTFELIRSEFPNDDDHYQCQEFDRVLVQCADREGLYYILELTEVGTYYDHGAYDNLWLALSYAEDIVERRLGPTVAKGTRTVKDALTEYPHECPRCEREEGVEVGLLVEEDAHRFVRHCSCSSCGFEWSETYTLTDARRDV